MDSAIQKVDIVINGEVVPELINIYHDWYYRFAISNNKMNPNDCGRFIKVVTGGRDEILGDDHRVKELFDVYDKNNDGFLEVEEFVSFYINCTLKTEKNRIIWENLKQMGIRNDLKRVNFHVI